MANRAVFLDRDGVICEALPRKQYLLEWNQFVFLPGIQRLVDEIHRKGYLAIVVTNQAKVGMGVLKEEILKDIHRKMEDGLGGKLDAIYYCPHVEGCECRKPKPGMLLDAQKKYDIDPAASFMIGDSDKDVGAGKAFGAKTIFLKNEYNADELKECEPDFVIDTLEEALQYIP